MFTSCISSISLKVQILHVINVVQFLLAWLIELNSALFSKAMYTKAFVNLKLSEITIDF